MIQVGLFMQDYVCGVAMHNSNNQCSGKNEQTDIKEIMASVSFYDLINILLIKYCTPSRICTTNLLKNTGKMYI